MENLTITSKVNQKTFLPGDPVLLKRGCSWTGHLHLLGNGSSTAPLVVDAYRIGPAPIINAAGGADSGGSSYAVGIWNGASSLPTRATSLNWKVASLQ